MDRGQDQRLVPMILDVMGQIKKDFSALDRIAITRGPGSFTGLRIGIAAARGLGLAANKPVIGIDRFRIYREQVGKPKNDLFVVIGSKRRELYCQFFAAQGLQQEPMMMTESEITKFLANHSGILVTGDTTVVEAKNFRKPHEMEAITCAALAARISDINDPEFLPRPLYVRAPDVTVKNEQKNPVFQSIA